MRIKSFFKKIKYAFELYDLKTFIKYSFEEILLLFKWFFLRSYSQRNEDTIMYKLLWMPTKLFYVDIGCNHPKRFSNTKKFYDLWRSWINIDPDPTNICLFLKERKRDINLNIGITKNSGEMTFYNFIPSNISTFSEERYEFNKKEWFKFSWKTTIKTMSLANFMEHYCKNKKIDFLSIDTEWLDYEILSSNDWTLYRPTLICVETVEHAKEKSDNDQIHSIMTTNYYKLVKDTGANRIYKKIK